MPLLSGQAEQEAESEQQNGNSGLPGASKHMTAECASYCFLAQALAL